MKRFLASLILLVWLAELSPVRGQQPAPSASAEPTGVAVILRDGREVLASAFRYADGNLLVTQRVANGTGEIGYPLADIEKVEFPAPPQLPSAANLLAENKAVVALAQLDPLVAYYFPFRSVPGNWWLPAARLKLVALGTLKREREVDALLAELSTLPGSAEAAEAARVGHAEALLRRNEPDKAAPIFDEIIKAGTDSDFIARSWVGKSEVFLQRGEADNALLACLRVPVFYPSKRLLLPPALLCSGEAFLGLDDRPHAQEAYRRLISEYPASSEAITARAKLQEMERVAPAPTQ